MTNPAYNLPHRLKVLYVILASAFTYSLAATTFGANLYNIDLNVFFVNLLTHFGIGLIVINLAIYILRFIIKTESLQDGNKNINL